MSRQEGHRRFSRLPLRARLVLGFAVAMTVVLIGSGAFVYWRVAFALDRRLDSDLADAALIVSALLRPDGTLRDTSVLGSTPALSDFQVLRTDGSVVSSGPGLGATSLLSRDELAAARTATITIEVGSMVPISARPLRLRAQPAGAQVLVVGVRRDARDEALRELVAQLAVAGLGTLVITTVVGERLAKAALRPVERYRAQADQITHGAPGMRLDVPAERDDEVTRLGHTLNTMLDALDHALSRERRFLQDASHELRTPLTLLRTRTQVALSRPRTVHEHEQTLRELDTDVRELGGLADQLLQLEVAADGHTTDAQPPSPGGNLGGVLVALHEQSRHGNVDRLPDRWTLDLPAATPVVAMSDLQLRQIATNLLVNASVHGQPPVHAAVRVAATTDTIVVLTVSDAGSQLPADFLPQAAERFGRAEDARSRPGAGLGLSLVHALVNQHEAELRLCSNGHHHRYQKRFSITCTHPPSGTTATVLITAHTTSTAPRATQDA